MTDLSISRQIFINIYPNYNLCDKIENYINNNKFKIKLAINLCKLGRWEWFFNCKPFFKLCLVYAYLPITKNEYDKKGISYKIFYDTMSDIKIWIDDHKDRTNNDGLYELNWINLHLSLKIFKLGRLQYQMFFYYDKKPYNKNGKTIKLGDKILNIHIPRGEKLDINECEKSIKQSKDFFKKYYPEYANAEYICHSWLLYSENKKYMNENSNIIKFAKLFDIVSQKQAPSQAILWLFGKKISNAQLIKNKATTGVYIDTNKLNAKTSLQKSAIKHINNGGTLGDAYCVLK